MSAQDKRWFTPLVSSVYSFMGFEYEEDRVAEEIDCIKKFVLVGLAAAVFETVFLFGFVEFAGFNYLVVSVFAIELAILGQYFLNNAWTFEGDSHGCWSERLRGLVKTNLVRGTSIPLQVGVLFLITQVLGVFYLVANIGAMLVAGAYRYVLDSRWVWDR